MQNQRVSPNGQPGPFPGLLCSQIDSGEYLIKNNGIPIDSLLTTPLPVASELRVAGGDLLCGRRLLFISTS